MKSTPKIRGARFRALLKASPYQANEFAGLLGFANSQNITHWYSRGVPASHATLAAEILKCEPAEISNVATHPIKDPKDAEIKRLKLEIKSKIDQILDGTDQLNTLKMIESQIDAYKRLTEQ